MPYSIAWGDMDSEPVSALAPTSPNNAAAAPNSSIEIYKAIRAHELMLNQATSQFEHATATPLVLLNGGAAVAYLTLLGAVSDPQKSRFKLAAAWVIAALIAWTLGLIVAQASATFGLNAQRAYARAQRLKREGVERELLKDQPSLLSVVARSNREPGEEQKEVDRGKRNASWFDRARLVSLVCFLTGVAIAAVSIHIR